MQNTKSNLAKTTIQGTLWIYASGYSGKLMAFLATIILARVLAQDDFGVAGYAFLVIGYMDIMRGLGIGPALIYHDEDPDRTVTGFWLGLGMGLTLFALTWLVAPLAGDFFNDARAIPVTQTLGLTFPISALGIVHYAMLNKNLAFKQKFVPDFVQGMSRGLISVILAILGFGVWSLIYGQLAGQILAIVTVWWIVPWRPQFVFKPQSARSLLSYGSNIISVRLLSSILNRLDFLLVGRFFGAATLGVYTLGFRVPQLLISRLTDGIGEVLFPVFTKIRDDLTALSRGFLTTLSYTAIISIPLGLGLALVSKPFVLVVFGQKWIEAVPVIFAISISSLFSNLGYNCGAVYKAQGRPDILAKFHVVKFIILALALWWAITGLGTLTVIAWAYASVTILNAMAQLIGISWMLNIRSMIILETLRPAAISGAVMTLMVWVTLLLLADTLPIIQLVVGTVIGGLVYAGVIWWLQREEVIRVGLTLRAALVRR